MHLLLNRRVHLNSVATAAVTMATALLMMSFRWSSASARAVAERFASALHRTYRNALTRVAPPAHAAAFSEHSGPGNSRMTWRAFARAATAAAAAAAAGASVSAQSEAGEAHSLLAAGHRSTRRRHGDRTHSKDAHQGYCTSSIPCQSPVTPLRMHHSNQPQPQVKDICSLG